MTTETKTEPQANVTACTIPVAALRGVLAATDTARSADQARPILTGWLVDATRDAGKLTVHAVATDSYVLTTATATLEDDGADFTWTALVGSTTRVKWADLGAFGKRDRHEAPDATADIIVNPGDMEKPGTLTIVTGNSSITLDATDGEEFPMWRQLIPERHIIDTSEVPLNSDRLGMLDKAARATAKAVRGSATPVRLVHALEGRGKPTVWTWKVRGDVEVDVTTLIMPTL